MPDWAWVWCKALNDPEIRRWLSLTAAGFLGAFVSAILDARAIILPCWRGRRIELGTLGPVLVSITAAHLVDHDFQSAFLGALCGMSTLRHIRSQLQAAFDCEARILREGSDGRGPND
jgi:hypothetical protein